MLSRICRSVLPLLLLATSLPGQTSPEPSIDFQPVHEPARECLTRLLERAPVPAVAVAVAYRGQIVFEDAQGFADPSRKTLARRGTLFGIGSITKSLTCVLLMKLAEEGTLDLDRPVETYLPSFHHKGAGITPRLIAGHLSGLDDSFAAARWTSDEHFETTEAALRHIEREKLIARPGERHSYATGTYTILAGVIEAVTKQDFRTALKERVLDPLELESTLPNDPRKEIANRTQFFLSATEDGAEKAPTFDPSHKWAGAGYLSTAADLARFGSALTGPGFLKEESLAELFRTLKTRSGEDTGFALGFQRARDDQGRRVVHQPGGGPGISAWLMIYPEQELVFVILSNLTRAPVGGEEFGDLQELFLSRLSG